MVQATYPKHLYTKTLRSLFGGDCAIFTASCGGLVGPQSSCFHPWPRWLRIMGSAMLTQHLHLPPSLALSLSLSLSPSLSPAAPPPPCLRPHPSIFQRVSSSALANFTFLPRRAYPSLSLSSSVSMLYAYIRVYAYVYAYAYVCVCVYVCFRESVVESKTPAI